MPIGPGSLDANGIWQFGEADTESLASDLLNLGMESVSDQFVLDRLRLTTLETKVNGSRVFTVVNAAGTISSATFAAIPTNPCSASVTAPTGGRLARVTYTFHGVCTAGTLDVGLAVSGATTVAATEAWTGASHVTANGAYATVFGATFASYRVEKLVQLNAGSNTITAQARIGGAGGTKQVSNQFLTVELI